MNSRSPIQAHPSHVLPGSSVARCHRLTRLFRRRLFRKLICFALISSLLILPGPGVALSEVRALASTAVGLTTSPIHYLQPILRSLFGLGARARARREGLADRLARVAQVRISPFKLVGYTEEGATFTAVGADLFDRTIPGLKFSWESSDPDKLQIDEAGRVTFLQSGLARVICRAGTAVGSAPVLIRANHRPVQTDSDWRNDQNGLDASGNIVGELGGGESTIASAKSLLNSLLDKLTPTAYAQDGGGDLVYPELWTESRNLVGSPRNRAAEPTAMGAVLPEGSDYEWAAPIYSTFTFLRPGPDTSRPIRNTGWCTTSQHEDK